MEFCLTEHENGRSGSVTMRSCDIADLQLPKDQSKIVQVQNGPKKQTKLMDSPGFMVYTRYGCIPNLTHDVAEYLPTLPRLKLTRLCEL